MKLHLFLSSFLVLASVVYTTPAGETAAPVDKAAPQPAVDIPAPATTTPPPPKPVEAAPVAESKPAIESKPATEGKPAADPKALPTITSFTPKTIEGKAVQVEDLCDCRHSPARNQTILAFQAFRTAKLYMLASIINQDPTHSELQEAAKWQIGQTEEILKVACELRRRDKSVVRRNWYKLRQKWLKFKIKVAKKLLAKGLPSWPWLGKFVNWIKEHQAKMKAKWDKFKHKVSDFFHKKKGDKYAKKGEAAPAAPTTPPAATPATEEAKKAIVVATEKVDVGVSKEELRKQIEAETPAKDQTKEQVNAAAEAKANDSVLVKTQLKPIVPGQPLIQQNGQLLSEEAMKKLGQTVQLEVAKVDVVLEDIDTTKLC